ncbi:unnamed protein product, partial [Ranitomeya imitator]
MANYEESTIYINDIFRTHALSSWPGLDFTMTHNLTQVNFLDTIILKNDQEVLSTDLFTKPTDRKSLLHYQSFHSTKMKNSIPKSQFKRVHRIVSDATLQKQRLEEMRSKFMERGYPPHILDIYETTSIPNSRMRTSHPKIKECNEPFLPCFSRPCNIRDKLVTADIGTLHQAPRQRFLANPRFGTFPCLHCTQCNNVQKGNTFYHPHNGKQYTIKGFFTSDTSFVIYLVKCPCGLSSVGKTTQPIKDRISKHKSTIRRNNTLLPIPYHFITKGHTIAQLKFQVIEQVTPPRKG